jgi:hypothetical protein
MARIVIHLPKVYAPPGCQELWFLEDGQGSSEVLIHAKRQDTKQQNKHPTRNTSLPTLEPRWQPSEPVYSFPIRL